MAAEHAPALVRDRVRAAADAFEQAARAPGVRWLEGGACAGWRSLARASEQAPRAARGGGAAVVLTLLIAPVEAVEAVTFWHRAQARVATGAAVLLRNAAALTGSRPGAVPEAAHCGHDAYGGPWPATRGPRYRCTGAGTPAPCSAAGAAGPAGPWPMTRPVPPRGSRC